MREGGLLVNNSGKSDGLTTSENPSSGISVELPQTEARQVIDPDFRLVRIHVHTIEARRRFAVVGDPTGCIQSAVVLNIRLVPAGAVKQHTKTDL